LNPQDASQSKQNAKATDRVFHCIWCNSTSHSRKGDCLELDDALKKGLITINAKGHIINAKMGEEMLPMFKRGKMKKLFEMVTGITSTVVSTSVITLEEASIYDTLRESEGKAHLMTINLDNGTQRNDIVDVEINKKCQHDGILCRQVRSYLDDKHIIPLSHTEFLTTSAPAPSTTTAVPKAEKERKHKLVSELNQTIDAFTIGEMLMNTMIELPIWHICAVAP